MNEIAFFTDGGKYYDACREYLTSRNAAIHAVEKFCVEHGIAKEDYSFTMYGQLFIQATPQNEKFRKMSCKDLFYDDDKKYFVLKRNSKLWKEFEVLYKSFGTKHAPDPLGWLIDAHRLSWKQFFYEDKLYINASSSTNNIEVPTGFEGMKLSAYYAFLENLEENKFKGVERI